MDNGQSNYNAHALDNNRFHYEEAHKFRHIGFSISFHTI